MRIRLLILIPMIVMAIYTSVTTESPDEEYERNRSAKENVRQAFSIQGMWCSGVSAAHIPMHRLSSARTLAEQALASNADEEIKRDAATILATLNSLTRFAQFADRFDDFAPEFERLRRMVRSIDEFEVADEREPTQEKVAKFLVVTAQQHPFYQRQPDEDLLFFDAEFNEALGNAIALSPDELTSLIVLRFSRVQSGEYRSKDEHSLEEKDPFGKFAFPAYTHNCRAVIVDCSDSLIVAEKQFSVGDPPEKQLQIFGAASIENGHDILRASIRQWIEQSL